MKHEGGVVIQGASGLLVRIAKCCNPVPGDDIVGYITKGRGVAIHRVDCMNLRSQENYEQRLLDVEWGRPIFNQGIYGSYRYLWTQPFWSFE